MIGKKKSLKIALVNPPLLGHKLRGIGSYTDNLYQELKKRPIDVSLVDFRDSLAQFDLVHYPYFDPFFLTLPLIKKKPTVVTVHDLIPLKFPKYFEPGIRGRIKWLIQKKSLLHVDAVITDSFASCEDSIKYTGIKKDKISVIYLGVDSEFEPIKSGSIKEEIRTKLRLPQEFILNVGDVNYNKNIIGLIKALSLINKTYPYLHLVLIGRGFINHSTQLREILSLINQLGLEKKIHRLGYLDLKDLIIVYNLAKAYIQPSFAEGFGLPVLEAMACGCPMVVSNVSSLPEVVGESAIKVDPNNIKSIAKGIQDILSDESAKTELIRRGLERARLFSWEKTAKKTIEIYYKVLNEK